MDQGEISVEITNVLGVFVGLGLREVKEDKENDNGVGDDGKPESPRPIKMCLQIATDHGGDSNGGRDRWQCVAADGNDLATGEYITDDGTR